MVLLVFNYIEKKYFCSKVNAIIKVLKMNIGSKFRAWVYLHSAILQSSKFQENLGRTAVVLPLLA